MSPNMPRTRRSRRPGRVGPAASAWVAAVSLAFLPCPASAGLVRDHLYGVKALSATEAWAVGNFGSIYHTTDAGKTWQPRESGLKAPLFSVDFADARQGWAVGKAAAIVHTGDGGATWKTQKAAIPTEKHLFKVQAVDARTVWAVGDWGAITVTHDGGEHWEDRSLGVVTVDVVEMPGRTTETITDDVILYDVSFPDAQHGYIGGEFGTILVTSDGGQTWHRRSTGNDKTLFGLYFTTPERGWAVGIDGLLLRTRDGGHTWDVQRGRTEAGALEELGFLEVLKNPGLYAVKIAGQYGVVVGDTGTLLSTADGGETWSRLELPEKDRLAWMRDVSLVPGTHGFTVGAAGFSAAIDHDQVTLPDGGTATKAESP